jgi:superfamily II DNA or RNA helicase
MELYPFQREAVAALMNASKPGARNLLVSPTGAGKTVMASEFVQKAHQRGYSALFCVDRALLVKQTFDKFAKAGIRCGVIRGAEIEDRNALIQIATIQTLAKRDFWKNKHFDFTLMDEAHTTTYQKPFPALFQQGGSLENTCLVGLTATPWRLKKKESLSDHYNTVISTPLTGDLQKMGMLCKADYWGIPGVDMSTAKVRDGDFTNAEMRNACDHPAVIARSVEEWLRLVPGRRTIAFCVDIPHSIRVRDAFRAAGVRAEQIDGNTPDQLAEYRYSQLAANEIAVLTSVEKLTTGFDCPPVEVALLLRPTASLALHVQMIGRVLRLSPQTGKTQAWVLDQAGNLARLGFPEDITEIDLGGGRWKKGEVKTKECPQCRAILSNFASECSQCGYKFPASIASKRRRVYMGQLTRLEREQVAKENRENDTPFQAKLRAKYQDLLREAYQKKWLPGYARGSIKRSHKLWTPTSWGLYAIFGTDYSKQDVADYWHHLARLAAEKRRELDPWNSDFVKRYMTHEFGAHQWEPVIEQLKREGSLGSR